MADKRSARANAARAANSARFRRLLLRFCCAFAVCMVCLFSRSGVFRPDNRCFKHPIRTFALFQAQARKIWLSFCGFPARRVDFSARAPYNIASISGFAAALFAPRCARAGLAWFKKPQGFTACLSGVCNCVAISPRGSVDRTGSEAYDICVLVRVIHLPARKALYRRRRRACS